ncbi:hypothetical protein LTR17_022768 [Elasticomyces elasticus]|nr:hypothetical protein LTR17_022768 [Elasticomyces elasticus]
MDTVSVVNPQPTRKSEDLGPADHNSKRCHLLEIPPEMRVRIYEYVYDEHNVLEICITEQGTVLRSETGDATRDQMMRHLPSLLKTCTLISREANPGLYRSLQFSVGIDSEFRSHYPVLHLIELCSIHDCLFFGNVQRLKLCIWLRRAMSARASEYLGLIRGDRKASATKTTIEEVIVFNRNGAGEGVDEVYAALVTLSYRTGARFSCSEDFFGRPRFVSEHVLKNFEQKTGVLRCVRAAPGG